ncbi:MAG: hypothetical protein ACKOCX_10505 [Planctomycetota bacterium]
MSRNICLAIALAALAAAPGCSSCFGGGSSCRRPSFMEFRSPCGGRSEPCPAPMAPPCAPACDPCAAPAPCCEGGGISAMPGGVPISAPAGEPGTFS